MDTNPYSNIRNAIGMNSDTPTETESGNPSLSALQQAENYDYFSKEIMGKNVYLPDLMKKIESLEKEVSDLKAGAKNEVDTDLFDVMESTVKNVQSVKDARKHLGDVKSDVIHDMCMKDQRYQEAYYDYRKAVKSAYVSRDTNE